MISSAAHIVRSPCFTFPHHLLLCPPPFLFQANTAESIAQRHATHLGNRRGMATHHWNHYSFLCGDTWKQPVHAYISKSGP